MIPASASIILPTYNEAGHIADLVNALKTHVAPPVELIVVDDASPDGTGDLVAALDDTAVRLIRRRQRGLVTALQTGIDACRGDIIGWLDADYSHPPDVAGQLVELIRNNACDVAIASRFALGGGESLDTLDTWRVRAQKRASSFTNQRLRQWLSPVCSDWTSGFIAVNADFIKEIRLNGYYGDYFIRMVGELLMSRARIEEVPFQSPPRRSGCSKTTTSWMRLSRLTWHYLQTIRMTRKLCLHEPSDD
jgi:dolichol-phosphate mannosyltransferase